jgi:hypothetical protein
MLTDIIGQFIGVGSCLAIYFLYRYSDSLSDGNIGAENVQPTLPLHGIQKSHLDS